MSSIAKAAVISAAVLCAFLAFFILLVQRPASMGGEVSLDEGKTPPEADPTDAGEKPPWLSGRILTEGKIPIAGARVTALEDLAGPGADVEELLHSLIRIPELEGTIASEAISAGDGTYRLDGLEPRYYTVRVIASGYMLNEVRELPASRRGVDIVLRSGAGAGGIVKNEEGVPVEGATVKAYSEIVSESVFDIILEKARPPIDIATTGPDGAFRFETLGSDAFNFLVEAKGHQQTQELDKKVSEVMHFVLKRGSRIRGVVRGPNDEPIAGARVRADLTGARGRDRVRVTFEDESMLTDGQGSFAFDSLEQGQYTLLCWHPEYQTLRLEDVRPTGDELVLKLLAGWRLRGRVVDASTGASIAGACIWVEDLADLRKEVISDDNGAFVLSGLTSRHRFVKVTAMAQGFARTRRSVEARENSEVEESFELIPTGSVSGIIVDSNGEPICGAGVSLKRIPPGASAEGTLGIGVTDLDGRFLLKEIESGSDCWVRVKKGPYIPKVSDRFSVLAGQHVEVPQLVLKLGGSIAGKVLGPDGNVIVGCRVDISREGETEIQRDRNFSSHTNARGEFLIQGLVPGQVDLICKPAHGMKKTVAGVSVIEGQLQTGLIIQTGHSGEPGAW